MIELTDGIILYHASYMEIQNIDLNRCKKGLDFGRGFYTTSSYQQAYNYVPQAIKKYNFQRPDGTPELAVNDGRINIYKLHLDPNLFVHCFNGADSNWLHFVVANRDNSLFPELLRKLESTDIIGGKIADDNTRRTLVDYIAHAYGVPGTNRADQLALEMLMPNRLKDQFCFRTIDAIKSLEFVRSECYGDIEKPID